MSSLSASLARGAYSLALRALVPAYLWKLWRRGAAEPLYRHAWGERFGLSMPPVSSGAIWLHAVSLGETLAARALVDALRDLKPGVRFVLTHGTATGREAGKALLREGDLQTWLPFDTPGAVRRFLRHVQPAVGVLMETEIWPNLLHEAYGLGVPMVLANARLSEKSARQGRRLSALMRPAADALTCALAQTDADALRLRDAGVAKVEVCGNLKYDLNPNAKLLAEGRFWRASFNRPIVAAVSTREGEEAELLAQWLTWPTPRPLLLLVPRHPQRFDVVAELIAQTGLLWGRRSQWGQSGPEGAQREQEIWLGDSLGEMALYYGMADLALLGGSFQPLGGHNLIESAACGCPIIVGPSTFNFAQAADHALAAGAAWRVDGWSEALSLAQRLLQEPEKLSLAGRQAVAFASAHRGAARRMAERILKCAQAEFPSANGVS